jgi:hypothetical protein
MAQAMPEMPVQAAFACLQGQNPQFSMSMLQGNPQGRLPLNSSMPAMIGQNPLMMQQMAQMGNCFPFALQNQNGMAMSQNPCFQFQSFPMMANMMGQFMNPKGEMNMSCLQKRNTGDLNPSQIQGMAPVGLPLSGPFQDTPVSGSWTQKQRNLFSPNSEPFQTPNSFSSIGMGPPATQNAEPQMRKVSSESSGRSLQSMYQGILNYVTNIIKFKTQEMVRLSEKNL